MKETVEERDSHMRKIQPRDQKWAEDKFDTKGYIYFHKHGALVDCFCGKCGTKYIGLWKVSEDPFEAALQNPIKAAHNKPGKCRMCGYETKYKAAGKVRDRYVNAKGRYVIGQRMGKDEFVFRVFDVEQVMYKNRPVKYDHMEYIRIFLRPGKRAQKDYFIYDWWAGRDRWIDHNLGGMSNIPMPDDAYITPSTYREIRNTPMFKYVPDPEDKVARDRYFHDKSYPLMRYYEAAAHYPDFEMIVKTEMYRLVNAMIWKLGTGYRSDRKTYYDRLGIYKSRVKDLIEAYGSGQLLKVFQAERRSGSHWDGLNIKVVADRITGCSAETDTLIKIYKHASPAKVERYIEKIIKKEGCGAFREYMDYIDMRKKMGYDLSNEIILFPRELHRRHNEMVLETENKKLDERKKEVLRKYPKVAEKYKKLSDIYSAAAAGYIIRPAKDAAEIVAEGRILHHCVGSNNMYISAHNNGRSTILFLRKASDPDMPFITVEIKGEEIKQWFGAYDKKPDREFFEGWLSTYTNELKKRKGKKKDEKAAKTA